MDVASQNASQVAIELIEEGWEIEAEPVDLPVSQIDWGGVRIEYFQKFQLIRIRANTRAGWVVHDFADQQGAEARPAVSRSQGGRHHWKEFTAGVWPAPKRFAITSTNKLVTLVKPGQVGTIA